MRIGIFGGTFNPVHTGHLIIAQDLMVQKKLDRIIFIPSNNPPHKTQSHILHAKTRLEMLRLAVEDNDRFYVDDIETKRQGYSYTIDTMTALAKRFNNDTLYFIIGADSLFEIHLWKDAHTLIESFLFLIAQRQAHEITQESMQTIALPKHLKDKLKKGIVSTPVIDISATTIRQRCKNNKPIRYLVPEKVRVYIEEHNLFKE